MSKRIYVIACLIPTVAFGVAGSIGMQSGFLPTLPVILPLFALADRLGGLSVFIAGVLNGLAFAAVNSYLPIIVRRRATRPTKWVWLPSLLVLGLLFVLSALFYVEGRRYGIEYEGGEIGVGLGLWHYLNERPGFRLAP